MLLLEPRVVNGRREVLVLAVALRPLDYGLDLPVLLLMLRLLGDDWHRLAALLRLGATPPAAVAHGLPAVAPVAVATAVAVVGIATAVAACCESYQMIV